MQIKDHSCVRINSSTEPAHANTEASVRGYRLDSGTRSMNFEFFALNISISQNRTHQGKKMKNCMLGVLVIQIGGVIFVLCSGRTRCYKPRVYFSANFLFCA